MAGRRVINVRWMRPNRPRPLDLDGKPDTTITYDGTAQTVRTR
jgi:hypothetical protein